MSLTLYNSLTRREEPFQPIESGKVRMYCCGVTVYDYCHVGHARAYIVWDMVRRYLIWRGYDVRYVQNFTDIDDKILNRARETNSTMEAVAERFIEEYFADTDKLNILRADEYPRATHSLDGIKRLIHELENKGFAYAAGGDVYYSVKKFADYGKLSGRNLAQMQAGASGRLETEEIEGEKSKMLLILPCGKVRNRENLFGILLGGMAAPDGTLNVRQWCAIVWEKRLTFIAAVPI